MPLIHPSLIKECVEYMDKMRIKTLLYRSDPEKYQNEVNCKIRGTKSLFAATSENESNITSLLSTKSNRNNVYNLECGSQFNVEAKNKSFSIAGSLTSSSQKKKKKKKAARK